MPYFIQNTSQWQKMYTKGREKYCKYESNLQYGKEYDCKETEKGDYGARASI